MAASHKDRRCAIDWINGAFLSFSFSVVTIFLSVSSTLILRDVAVHTTFDSNTFAAIVLV